MHKKLTLVFVVIVFFLFSHLALASLSINEVMYDLSGSDSTNSKSREWIEIYNSSSSEVPVDATKWRIYDGSGNRTLNGEVNFSFPGNSYVVFAGDKDTFLIDHPGFSGTVYDTSISSLNNTGATIKILDADGNSLDSMTYTSSQGGAGDGNSLQKVAGVFSGRTPTPGLVNESGVSNPPPPNTSPIGESSPGPGGLPVNTNGSVNETKSKDAKVAEEKKIKIIVDSKDLEFVGLPIVFQVTTQGARGEKLYNGRYYWNFGDGDAKEATITGNDIFRHSFFYPGDYIVTLNYFENFYSDQSGASIQIPIKIIPNNISINGVGDEKDFFVELKNNTEYNADLSGWTLASNGKSFVIPKNTLLAAKKSLIISPHVSNLSIADKGTLKLLNPEKQTVFDFNASAPKEVLAIEATTEKITAEKITPQTLLPNKDILPKTEEIKILPTDMSANVQSANLENNNKSGNSSWLWIVSFIIFITVAGSLVYFLRVKKAPIGLGNDFEIIDE